VACGGSGGTSARGPAIVFRAGTKKSLFHARLDIAFGLAANGG